MDVATEALIAQVIADDQDYYDRLPEAAQYSYAIGGSYHDYEDPTTSYKRQPEQSAEGEEEEEGSESEGWGLHSPADN